MRQLIALFFLLGTVHAAFGQQATRVSRDPITARVSIVQQSYCRGDADLFTVSLKLKLEVVNSSKTPVYILWPMVPWIGKVAGGVGDAEGGRFLYEITASHYPQDVTRFDRLKIEPGKKVTVQTGYDLVARHDPAFSYPKSVSTGSYAVVLVLRPEEEPPTQLEGPDTLNSITTEPFVVEVPATPKLVSCEAGAKAQ
jgi:hypothetical protein